MHHYFDKHNECVWLTARKPGKHESYFYLWMEQAIETTEWGHSNDETMTSFNVSQIFLDVMLGKHIKYTVDTGKVARDNMAWR